MPLTTSEVGDAYNVSAYDGITFRARTGGGPTTQPVFVEILTKETQPTTRGRHRDGRRRSTCTTTAGSSRTSPPRTYQQFFVPFGALIPRSLPATGTAGHNCPTPAAMCQAPKFVPANALGDPVLVLRSDGHAGVPDAEPGGQLQPVHRRRGVLQALALPSGTSDLPARSASRREQANAFPRNPTPANGCFKAQGSDGRLITQAYDNWKTQVRARGGRRLPRRAPGGRDRERRGHRLRGYRLRDADLRVHGRQDLFDGFWTYWKAHCAVGSGDTCLMTWRSAASRRPAARRPTPTRTRRSRC